MFKFLIILLVLIPQLVRAQQRKLRKDSSLSGKVLYLQRLHFGTNIKAIDTLKFNRTKSIFTWQRLNKNKKNVKKYTAEGLEKIKYESSKDKIGQINLYNTVKDSLYSRTYVIGHEYLLKDKKPIIDWKITDSTKKIGHFICTKATTHFRGRNYIVWFTPEIPLPYGPWKLTGLPGLILEANDKSNDISFQVKKVIFKNIDSIGPVPLNGGEKVIDLAEYKKMMINYKQKQKIEAQKFASKYIRHHLDKNSKVKDIKVSVPKPMEIFADSTNHSK
jgi:GLPGLI family protein